MRKSEVLPIDLAKCLNSLLQDPQPGLATWCKMYGETMQSLCDFWNDSEPKSKGHIDGISTPLATRSEPPKTVEQCALIALAEYEYWRGADYKDTDTRIGQIQAMGSAANIYAAISHGLMAPWHPKLENVCKQCGRTLAKYEDCHCERDE